MKFEDVYCIYKLSSANKATAIDIDYVGDLIQCKDCRFWDWMPASTATPDYHLCRRPFQKIAMTEHDFCSKAERKDDD